MVVNRYYQCIQDLILIYARIGEHVFLVREREPQSEVFSVYV